MPQKNWDPEEYDKQSVLQYNTAMSMLDNFSLKGYEKILDIGCGTGKISAQIAKQRVPRGSVLGLDINERMINFAKSHYKYPNLEFERGDVLSIEYKDSFDVVISFWTLSWVPFKDQLVVLKPRTGVCVIKKCKDINSIANMLDVQIFRGNVGNKTRRRFAPSDPHPSESLIHFVGIGSASVIKSFGVV